MITNIIEKHLSVIHLLADADEVVMLIEKVASEIVACYKAGGKVMLCGNGGSAADAQHIAAELSGRFYFDRDPLDAIALHTNSSAITAISNDYSFNDAYARILKGIGKKNDILIAISTSGNSENIIQAVETAQKIGVKTIGMTGQSGGKLKDMVETLLPVPSDDTPRIQETHILIGHIICEIVEKELFGS